MNIRVDLNYPIKDGTEVLFRSPVDCSQITGLILYYPENGATVSHEFAFADAHGNNVGDIDHLFAENVVVKVILDVTTSMAFVQNADTNAYLEGRFKKLEDKIGAGGGGGSGSPPLIVEITEEDDNYTSTHYAEEIYLHMKNVGDVLIYHNGYYFVPTVIDSAKIVFHYFNNKRIEKVTIWKGTVSVDQIAPESNLLVVTITDTEDGGLETSHSAWEIQQHYVSGGNAVIDYDYSYWSCDRVFDNETVCHRLEFDYKGNCTIEQLTIYEDTVTIKRFEMALKSDIGDIETALDAIIEIQNELIGGDGV